MNIKTSRLSTRSGFTLIEILSTIVVASMTIMLVMSVYIAGLNNFNSQCLTWTGNRSTEMAIEYISKDIRAAVQPVATWGSSTTSANSIVVQVPSYNSAGIISNSFDYIAYNVDNNKNLTRTITSAGASRTNETNRIIAKNISALSLAYSCQDEFTGDGTTSVFTSSFAWTGTPTVTINSQPASGYTLDAANHKVTFAQPPTAQSTVGLLYQVLPSNTSALSKMLMVNIQITSRQTAGKYSASSSLTANVRLRNNR